MKNFLLAIVAIWFVAGCSTYAADRYAISMDSQVELERVADASPDRKITVDAFTATEPGLTEIDCRAVGPIKTPDGETFEAYVRKALIDQLRLAHLYAPDGDVRIGGNLDEINFSSHEGMWYVVLTIKDDAGRSFTVREDYDFESSWYGETACNQTAQALMPAIQNLIRKTVNNPVFQEMIMKGA
jgi:hypothetical protein